MNRERARELLPVYQAFCDGAAIQCRDSPDGKWRDSNDPVIWSDHEWRVKPEPHDIKWAAEKVGQWCRRRAWREGVYWDGARLYSSTSGRLDIPLLREDILADDWELYEPK